MRLGGNVFVSAEDPFAYAQAIADAGFRAGYFPYDHEKRSKEYLIDFKKAFDERGLIIAEVGAWGNPMSSDREQARQNEEFLIYRLQIAEEIGARCCVNVVGSRQNNGDVVKENFSKEFYDEAVDLSRRVIDMVKPKNTHMCFELLPWNFLNSADTYIQFVKDINREAAGIHLDPVNCILDIPTYLDSDRMIRESFAKLAPYGIYSVHLKDISMRPSMPNVMLDEVLMGTGSVNIPNLLQAMEKYLQKDTPVMLEHLNTDEEYQIAANVLRSYAKELKIEL